MCSMDSKMKDMPSLSPAKKGRSPSHGQATLSDLLLLSEDEQLWEQGKFTFPQLSPSMILHETLHSLDSKVPLIPGLDEVMMLCTTKIGTKRFQSPVGAEFDLRSPHSPGLEYNYLHDPHLKKYFRKAYVRESLAKQGLIAGDGFVKCSTREFNEYRQWIRRLKLNKIEAEAKEKSETQECEETSPAKMLNDHAMELLEASKRKQLNARKKYREKMKKEKEERKRLMKNLEQEFKSKEQLRDEQQNMKKIKCRQREKEEEERRKEHKKNENTQRTTKIQALSEKHEQYTKRRKEIEDYRKMERKNKERKAIEKWKRRQSYCLKMMDEKKVQVEKEMTERKESMVKRNEVFDRERQRREDALEKSMQLSRELAYEHLRKANQFLEKAERRKEAEIKRWREKNLRRESPKPHLQRPAAIRRKRSKKSSKWLFDSHEQKEKKSMWKIDNCLNSSDSSDRKSRLSLRSDPADGQLNLSYGDMQAEKTTNGCKKQARQKLKESRSRKTGISESTEKDSLALDVEINVGEENPSSNQSLLNKAVAEKDESQCRESAHEIRIDDEIMVASRQLTEEILFRAATRLQIDLELVKKAMDRSLSEASLSSSSIGALVCLGNNFEASLASMGNANSFSGSHDALQQSVVEEPMFMHNLLQNANSTVIISTAKKLIETILNGAILKLGLDDIKFAQFIANIDRQEKAMEFLITAERDLGEDKNLEIEESVTKVTDEHCLASRESIAIERKEIRIGVSNDHQEDLVRSNSSGISIEAKQLVEDVLRTLGNELTSESDVVIIKESGSGLFDARKFSDGSIDIIAKRCQSVGTDVSVTAKRIAFKAVETELEHVEVAESGAGDDPLVDVTGHISNASSNKKRLSILLNADENWRLRANEVVKDAVIYAAEEVGCPSQELEKVEEYLTASETYQQKHVDRFKHAKVHFDNSGPEEEVRKPSSHSSALSNRLPTPHASFTIVRLQESLHENESCEETDLKSSSRKQLEFTDSKSEVRSSKEIKPKESTERDLSDEIIINQFTLSQVGRRPTPFFSKTEKKRLFEHMTKEDNDMGAFGEEEEFDENGTIQETESVSEIPSNHINESCSSKIDCEERFSNSRMKGSAPELGRVKSTRSYQMRGTFSGIVPNTTTVEWKDNSNIHTRKEIEAALISDRSVLFSQDIQKVEGNQEEYLQEVHTCDSNSSVKINDDESLKRISSHRLQMREEGSNTNIPNRLARRTMSKELSKSRSKSLSQVSIIAMNAKKSAISTDGSRKSSNCSVADLQCKSSVKIERKESKSLNGKRSSIRRVSPCEVTGKKSEVVIVKSDNTVGSTSSHFLPHARPSRSRMTCKIEPSVYSCNTDEVESTESMDSQEIIGLSDEQEMEQVVKIEQPDCDGNKLMDSTSTEQRLQEMPLSKENIEQVIEKLTDSTLVIQSDSTERVASKGSINVSRDFEHERKNDRSEEGSVIVFKYKEFVEMQNGKGKNSERLKSSNDYRESSTISIEAKKSLAETAVSEESDIKKADTLSDEGNADELLQDFVVIDETEMNLIKHVNAGVFESEEEENEVSKKGTIDAEIDVKETGEKEVVGKVLELEIRKDMNAFAGVRETDSSNNLHGRADTKKEGISDCDTRDSDEKERQHSEQLRLTDQSPGSAQSMVLVSPKKISSLKLISKSDIARRRSHNQLQRTSSSSSGINVDGRRTSKHRVSINQPSFDFPKEAGEKKVGSLRRLSRSSAASEDQQVAVKGGGSRKESGASDVRRLSVQSDGI